MPFSPLRLPAALLLLFVLVFSAVSPALGQADLDESGFTRVFWVDPSSSSGAANGSETAPFRTLGAAFQAVAALPRERIRVLVAPGIYREGGLVLQQRDALLVIEPSAPGQVVISGSDIWRNWTADGPRYWKHWPFSWGFAPDDPAVNENLLARRTETVFVDGVLQRQVLTLGDLVPGTYFVDEGASRLYLYPPHGENPEVATVEVGVRANLLTLREVSQFVLRGLVFEHSVAGRNRTGFDQRSVFITGLTDGGSETIFGHENRRFNENFLIEDCEFRWNNWVGLTIANAKSYTLRRVAFRFNGEAGFGTNRCRDVLWEECDFVGNNWRLGVLGGVYNWHPAGVKLLRYDNIEIRNSRFVGNHATGLWMDYGNTNLTVSGVTSNHNWSYGVYYEANVGPALIESSLVRNNGQVLRDDLWIGGLFMAESKNLTVRDSFLVDNHYFAVGTRNRSRFSTMYWTGGTYTGEVENLTIERSVLVGTRTGPEDKNFPSNFTDRHFNGAAILPHTHGTLSFFASHTAPTYRGERNRFFSPHTEQLFPNLDALGSGFNKVDLAAWQTSTGGQDADSFWDPDWESRAGFDAFEVVGGQVVIEAENTHRLEKRDDPARWTVRHGFHSGRLGHAGWGHLGADNPSVSDGMLDTAAAASYRIHADEAGEFALALRVWAHGEGADALHISVNGEVVANGHHFPASTDRWRWRHGPALSLRAGINTVTLTRKSGGLSIDRVMLARSMADLPEDGSTEIGPDESPLGQPVAFPTRVVGLTATPQGEGIGLAWQAFPQATGYLIERRAENESAFEEIARLEPGRGALEGVTVFDFNAPGEFADNFIIANGSPSASTGGGLSGSGSVSVSGPTVMAVLRDGFDGANGPFTVEVHFRINPAATSSTGRPIFIGITSSSEDSYATAAQTTGFDLRASINRGTFPFFGVDLVHNGTTLGVTARDVDITTASPSGWYLLRLTVGGSSAGVFSGVMSELFASDANGAVIGGRIRGATNDGQAYTFAMALAADPSVHPFFGTQGNNTLVTNVDNFGVTTPVSVDAYEGPTTFFDGSAAPGVEYSYRVRATTPFGLTDFSDIAAARISALAAIELWRAEHFHPDDLANPALEETLWGDFADPDGDGFTNLLEYALGGHPLLPGSASAPRVGRGSESLTLSFFRAREELVYEILSSSTLETWSVVAINPGVPGQEVEFIDPEPLAGHGRRFLRLRVSHRAN